MSGFSREIFLPRGFACAAVDDAGAVGVTVGNDHGRRARFRGHTRATVPGQARTPSYPGGGGLIPEWPTAAIPAIFEAVVRDSGTVGMF